MNPATESDRARAVDQYLRALHALGVISDERTTRPFLADFFRNVDFTGRRVLDIGGGEGIYSFYAAVMGAREVVCLEPEAAGSTSGVTQLFERIGEAVPGQPVRLDSRTLEQYHDAEGFDIILMNASVNHIDEDACIHLLEDPKARETFRKVFLHLGTLARPGSQLIVADCTRYNFFALLHLKNPINPNIEWHKHQAPEVWAALLQEVGFRNPQVAWLSLYRFGKVVQALLANKAAAYFLKSFFRLDLQKA
jgi:SAM-dependent methyltransferase